MNSEWVAKLKGMAEEMTGSPNEQAAFGQVPAEVVAQLCAAWLELDRHECGCCCGECL